MQTPTTSTTLLRELARDPRHARWTEFVDRYRPMMEAYLCSHFPGVDAEEAIAEVLVALVDVLTDYRYDPDEKGRFHNFLTGILRHKALRMVRMANRDAALRASLADESGVQAQIRLPDDAEENYRQALVEIALARFFGDDAIAARTKEIFRHVAVKGEDADSVARLYHADRHVVDQIKSRSLVKLRKFVAELEAADAR